MKFNNFLLIHRKILNWEWFKESKTFHLFIYFLIKANYKAKKWRGVLIKRGEFITSYSKLSQDTGLTIGEIRNRLKKLTQTGEIIKKSTTKYTKIKVCNYNKYQIDNSHKNNQMTNSDKTSSRKFKTSTSRITSKSAWNSSNKKDSNQHGQKQTNHKQITTTNKDKEKKESKPSNQDLPDKYLELSLFFHKQQKQNGLYHNDFKNELNYKSRIVIDGASTIDKLIRLDKEDIKDISHTLDFVLNDDFWMKNVISLNSIRKKSSRNGNSKYFNIKNSMLKTGQPKKYTLSDINKMGIKPNQINEYFIQTSNNQYKPTTKGKSIITKEK